MVMMLGKQMFHFDLKSVSTWGCNVRRFIASPFGLSSAPYVFFRDDAPIG